MRDNAWIASQALFAIKDVAQETLNPSLSTKASLVRQATIVLKDHTKRLNVPRELTVNGLKDQEEQIVLIVREDIIVKIQLLKAATSAGHQRLRAEARRSANAWAGTGSTRRVQETACAAEGINLRMMSLSEIPSKIVKKSSKLSVLKDKNLASVEAV